MDSSLKHADEYLKKAADSLLPFLGDRVHGCGLFKDGAPNNSPDAKDGIVAIGSPKDPMMRLLGFTDLVEMRYNDGTPCVGMISDRGLLYSLRVGTARSNWIEYIVAFLGALLTVLKFREYFARKGIQKASLEVSSQIR